MVEGGVKIKNLVNHKPFLSEQNTVERWECEGIENISLFLSANFLLYDQTEIQCFSPFVIFQELDISIWISWLESLNLKPTYHKPVYGNNPDQTRNSWNSETNVILILI